MTHKHPTDSSSAHTEGSGAAVSDASDLAKTEQRIQPAALPFAAELQRKALHLAALVIPVGMYVLGRTWALMLLLPLALFAVGADVLRTRSPRFSRWILSIFGRMLRHTELSPIGGRAVINGATWVLVAATLLTVIFPVDLAAPAFAAFMVADSAAAIVGLRFGHRRWRGTRRTIEGSSAFVAVALPCLLAFSHISAGAAAAAALGGAALEAPDWPINDNVRVPLVMAGILYLFGW